MFAASGQPLSRWHRQRVDSTHHASKQSPRQMALCHNQPVVPGVLDQSAIRGILVFVRLVHLALEIGQ
jgi:hypothetical protein